MHSSIDQLIDEAESLVAQLKLQKLQGSCIETGHEWKFLGGMNAGCDDDCGCSVPVYECIKCGDCDYGDNDEAEHVRRNCAEYDIGN